MLDKTPEVLQEGHPKSEAIFAFMDKFVFDVLPSLQENKHYQDIAKLYLRMLD